LALDSFSALGTLLRDASFIATSSALDQPGLSCGVSAFLAFKYCPGSVFGAQPARSNLFVLGVNVAGWKT
jgi:hypothetical protein|tara:strand:+ start:3359 stop:3568 length:210 start_codon:yes stop_codon:yes gene_type:complete